MDFKHTKHQVARGTRPDAIEGDTLILLKRLGLLRATYQVRLLIFMAHQQQLKLRIMLPKAAKLDPALRALVAAHPFVKVERYEPVEVK